MPIVLGEGGAASAGTATCEAWTTNAAVADCCGTAASDTLIDSAVAAASAWLSRESGDRFCVVTDTDVQPQVCDPACRCFPDGYLDGWASWSGGSWACSCSATSVVLDGHVISVESVTVDGEELEPSAYVVRDQRYLTRVDGADWPCCQSPSAVLGEEGTWSVDYTHGIPVPADGAMAALEIASELVKLFACPDECRLPAFVQSRSSQGINVNFLQPGDFDGGALAALPMTSSFLASLDTEHKRRGGSIIGPRSLRRQSVRTS